jgi:prefoldin subunit 5
MLADRRLRADEQTKKMEEMMKKQKEMKSMGLAMKIIGPIIAALATILGVLISIASLGTATAAGVALIAAGVTVGVAMTAYAIADSVTNVTQKIVTAFKDMLERLMPDSPEWAKALVKAIIVAVVVAILAVIIAVALASGGGAGAATNLASQAVQQTVRMAIMEAVKQIALQAMIMTIMSSNVLPELVGGILKASGVDKKTQQIVEMIVMAITLVACLIVMVKVGNMKVPGMEAGEAAEESAKTATEQAKNAVKEFSSNLEKMKEALKKLPAEAMDEWTSIIDGFKKLDKWDILSALCSSAPSAVQLVGGSITGSMQLKVSRLLKDIGEVKSAEEELEALIQALETLLRNIQQGMMNRDDFIAQLQQMYNNIYDAASKSQSLLFNALQG